MTPLLPWALSFALMAFALAMLCAAIRLLRGPAAEDRVLALDTLYVNGMLTMLTLGIQFGSRIYFDIALLIALFGFVGSAAMAKFLLRGEVIELVRDRPFIGTPHAGEFERIAPKLFTAGKSDGSYLIKRLKAIDEGGQSLFDNSLLMFCSNLFDGDRHQADEMPILLAGQTLAFDDEPD